MAYHQLKMYVPGADEPVESETSKAAAATLTNLFLPNVRGELSSAAVDQVVEWEAGSFNTTMSPVYDIEHTFTAPVRSFSHGLHAQTSELLMGSQHLTGILYGWFESVGLGDYELDPQWGQIFMFANQTPTSTASTSGLYIALPGDVPSPGSRTLRAFMQLNRNVSVQYAPVRFRATENVPVTVQPTGTSLRLFDVAQDALALPAAQGGMPLDTTDAAWDASSSDKWFKTVNFEWIDSGPFSGDNVHQFVFLELMHQTDPTENGIWRYDFATGSRLKGAVPYRHFTRIPDAIPNANYNPPEKYFSHNVRGANGALHYGRVATPDSAYPEFAAGSLALLLQDPGASTVNTPVTTLTAQSRQSYLYEYSAVGHELETGAWLFGTSEGHNSVFILRATQAGGVFTAGNTGADYRAAPLGTVLAGLNTTSFEALPLASSLGGPDITFLFLSNAVLTETTNDPAPNFKNTGTMLCGREFNADSMAFTHTLFQQRIGSSDTALDELRLRGLSVELPDVFATHGISHSSSGVGREHGRTPHVNIHIEDGKKTTSVERHNIHYRALRIPHQISYKYVYTDTGEALAAEHGDVIGKCVLTSQFRGFVV